MVYGPATTCRSSLDTAKKDINYITLAIFAPILILAGIAGFLVPQQQSLTSGATPYNLFHIFFGCLGLIFLLKGHAALFNLGFGLIDLYQAAASFMNLPPKQYFLWTRVDDVLHIVIGLALVVIGGYGLFRQSRHNRPSDEVRTATR